MRRPPDSRVGSSTARASPRRRAPTRVDRSRRSRTRSRWPRRASSPSHLRATCSAARAGDHGAAARPADAPTDDAAMRTIPETSPAARIDRPGPGRASRRRARDLRGGGAVARANAATARRGSEPARRRPRLFAPTAATTGAPGDCTRRCCDDDDRAHRRRDRLVGRRDRRADRRRRDERAADAARASRARHAVAARRRRRTPRRERRSSRRCTTRTSAAPRATRRPPIAPTPAATTRARLARRTPRDDANAAGIAAPTAHINRSRRPPRRARGPRTRAAIALTADRAQLAASPNHVHLVVGDDAQRVVITVAVRGNDVNVAMRATDDHTAAALARNAGSLDDAMRTRGLQLADFTADRDPTDRSGDPRAAPDRRRARPAATTTMPSRSSSRRPS